MSTFAREEGPRAPKVGTEVELVRRAARAGGEAFEELFRRHGQSAWRLARAMVLTRREAQATVAEGFVRALQAVRRHQVPRDEPFRPLILGGVYHASMDRLSGVDDPVSVAGTGRDPVLAAAFRSLPERWRATLWLTEVEGMTTERIAPILGVSPAVAVQLTTRAHRALADRLRQAGDSMPEMVRSELRGLANTVPASLSHSAATAWEQSMAADPVGGLLPSIGGLGERVSRPLAGVIGGVLSLGVIGLGTIGQYGPFGDLAVKGTGLPPTTTSAIGVTPRDGSGPFVAGFGGRVSGGSTVIGGTGGRGIGDSITRVAFPSPLPASADHSFGVGLRPTRADGTTPASDTRPAAGVGGGESRTSPYPIPRSRPAAAAPATYTPAYTSATYTTRATPTTYATSATRATPATWVTPATTTSASPARATTAARRAVSYTRAPTTTTPSTPTTSTRPPAATTTHPWRPPTTGPWTPTTTHPWTPTTTTPPASTPTTTPPAATTTHPWTPTTNHPWTPTTTTPPASTPTTRPWTPTTATPQAATTTRPWTPTTGTPATVSTTTYPWTPTTAMPPAATTPREFHVTAAAQRQSQVGASRSYSEPNTPDSY